MMNNNNKDCYKVIHDEALLREFIDWLPDLQDNEKFYGCLFARKKYAPTMVDSNDRTQLKRFTSDKSRLFDKISQLEVPLDTFKLKGKIVPQESLVLYIYPNPRDMVKATRNLGKKCWDLMNNQNFNPHAEALSCIQKSKSRALWVDFDIDDKSFSANELIMLVSPIIPFHTFKVLESRGGYHLLVNPQEASKFNPMWHPQIEETFKKECDNIGDLMMPVPGTIQGGFIPRFAN